MLLLCLFILKKSYRCFTLLSRQTAVAYSIILSSYHALIEKTAVAYSIIYSFYHALIDYKKYFPFSVSKNLSNGISSCLIKPLLGKEPLATISTTAAKEAAVVQEIARHI
jgi:hypothetical protein